MRGNGEAGVGNTSLSFSEHPTIYVCELHSGTLCLTLGSKMRCRTDKGRHLCYTLRVLELADRNESPTQMFKKSGEIV